MGTDGNERGGVLFVTDDMITAPLPLDDDPHNQHSRQQFAVYTEAVKRLRTKPDADAHDNAPGHHGSFPSLSPGTVVQPCHVRALRSGPWKLVRYCDPWSAAPVEDQWELYNMEADPTETCNLVVYNGEFPTVIPASSFPPRLHMAVQQVADTARRLRSELARLEGELLSPYPSAHPSAGAAIGQ